MSQENQELEASLRKYRNLKWEFDAKSKDVTKLYQQYVQIKEQREAIGSHMKLAAKELGNVLDDQGRYVIHLDGKCYEVDVTYKETTVRELPLFVLGVTT